MPNMGVIGDLTVIHRGKKCDVEWKMDFSSLSKKDGAHYWSPDISFEGESWYLAMHPNGCKSLNSSGGIHLRLRRWTSYGPPITLEFTFSIKTVNGQKVWQTQRTEDFEGCSWHHIKGFMSTPDFKKRQSEFLVSGSLTLVCTLKRMTSSGSANSEKFMHDFEIMLSGDLSDVTVKVKEEEFRLHKAILAARSLYFFSMFKNNMTENITNIVTIEDCDPDIFRSFIHFLYTGKVDKLSRENVCDLYEAADKYQEDQLKKKCLHFILNTLSVDSFCDYFELALRHDEKELLQKVVEFFIPKGKEIGRSVKWQTFLTKFPIQANELFLKALDHSDK